MHGRKEDMQSSEGGWVSVDRQEHVSLGRTTLVNRVACDVHDTAQCGRADGDGDLGTSVLCIGATDQTLGTCDEPYLVPT